MRLFECQGISKGVRLFYTYISYNSDPRVDTCKYCQNFDINIGHLDLEHLSLNSNVYRQRWLKILHVMLQDVIAHLKLQEMVSLIIFHIYVAKREKKKK